ncbi:MAG TPA: hypothetical protein VK821_21280 [Dehalococcoidia bacterium]|nr:hypothetical protein [Dehalococcoidia bacterium]
MAELTERERAVAHHYDVTIFDYELTRLPLDNPVEYAITRLQLERHAPPGAVVADVASMKVRLESQCACPSEALQR